MSEATPWQDGPGEIVTTGSEVISIPCARISPFEGQPRAYFDPELMAALKESIREEGQKTPALVRTVPSTNGNGNRRARFELIDGERRWRVCTELKRPLLAWVREPADRDEQFVEAVMANFNRADHGPLETAHALQRIRQMPRIQREPKSKQVAAIARMFGHSEVWAWQYLGLTRLHEKLQARLDPAISRDERLPITLAIRLSGLPKAQQLQLAKEIKKRKLKTKRANRLIDRAINESGLAAGRRGRKPSDDYKLFRAFLSRISGDMEPFLEMTTQGTFEEMLGRRSGEELETMDEELLATIQRLVTMHRTVKAIRKTHQ